MSKTKGKGNSEASTPERAAPPTGASSPERGLSEAAPPEPAPGAEGSPSPTPSALEALQRERDDLRDQLLRKRAEFENYRKRGERDRQQATQDAVAALLRELIPTLDNLERALKAGGGEEALRTGVELTLRELLTLLENHGVTAQEPVGQKFDPLSHEALLHEPAPGYEEGTVVEVYRKGYSLKDRLLRPALVKVAKGDTDDPAESGGIH